MRGTKQQFLIAAALVLAACDEAAQPVAPVNEPEPTPVTHVDQRLDELARATARALGIPTVRKDLLAAMRASTAVEHRLLLADYLRSPEGSGLLAGSTAALDIAEDEFLFRVEEVSGDIQLAIAVPLREHRLSWRGTAHIGVAGAWDTDELNLTVHEPDGIRRRATTVSPLLEYDALFLIGPDENSGTRMDRQADMPGPVIQDADDGEQAVIWTYDAGDGTTPVSIDFGRYDSEEALQEAIAEVLGTRTTCDPRCESSTDVAGHKAPRILFFPTWIHRLKMRQRTEWSPEEVEVRIRYASVDRTWIQSTGRYTGITSEWSRRFTFPVIRYSPAPHPHGAIFYIRAMETDFGRDDFLGSGLFYYESRQGVQNLWKVALDMSWGDQS